MFKGGQLKEAGHWECFRKGPSEVLVTDPPLLPFFLSEMTIERAAMFIHLPPALLQTPRQWGQLTLDINSETTN